MAHALLRLHAMALSVASIESSGSLAVPAA